MDGCGPSAIVALSSGDFLVTCYDSGSIYTCCPPFTWISAPEI
jgi:hypothetical protein